MPFDDADPETLDSLLEVETTHNAVDDDKNHDKLRHKHPSLGSHFESDSEDVAETPGRPSDSIFDDEDSEIAETFLLSPPIDFDFYYDDFFPCKF